jgi:hypothetical protein
MELPSIEKDSDLERRALRIAKRNKVSISQIMEAAKQERCAFEVHPDTVRRFRSGDSQSISQDLRIKIAKFFATPRGRSILMRGQDRESFDKLVADLSTGNPLGGKNIDGVYLEYHGSYLQKKCYAVRAIEINKIGSILSVRDKIKEGVSGLKPLHTAHGCAVLLGDPPRLNIITYAEDQDNRIGLSLFAGSIMSFEEGTLKLKTAEGHIFGLTNGGSPFWRASRIVRINDVLKTKPERDSYLERVVAQRTGVFTEQKLEDHRAEFETLIERMEVTTELSERFPDPCLKPLPKRSENQSSAIRRAKR